MYAERVSVRSYVFEYAKRTKQVIELNLTTNGQRMRINGETPYICEGQTFYTRHADEYIKANKPYKLYDFVWRPIIEQPEEITQDGRLAMLKAWKELNKKKVEQTTIEEV
jgi:hypothetical protein